MSKSHDGAADRRQRVATLCLRTALSNLPYWISARGGASDGHRRHLGVQEDGGEGVGRAGEDTGEGPGGGGEVHVRPRDCRLFSPRDPGGRWEMPGEMRGGVSVGLTGAGEEQPKGGVEPPQHRGEVRPHGALQSDQPRHGSVQPLPSPADSRPARAGSERRRPGGDQGSLPWVPAVPPLQSASPLPAGPQGDFPGWEIFPPRSLSPGQVWPGPSQQGGGKNCPAASSEFSQERRPGKTWPGSGRGDCDSQEQQENWSRHQSSTSCQVSSPVRPAERPLLPGQRPLCLRCRGHQGRHSSRCGDRPGELPAGGTLAHSLSALLHWGAGRTALSLLCPGRLLLPPMSSFLNVLPPQVWVSEPAFDKKWTELLSVKSRHSEKCRIFPGAKSLSFHQLWRFERNWVGGTQTLPFLGHREPLQPG